MSYNTTAIKNPFFVKSNQNYRELRVDHIYICVDTYELGKNGDLYYKILDTREEYLYSADLFSLLPSFYKVN